MFCRTIRFALALSIAGLLAGCSEGGADGSPPAGDAATVFLERQLDELAGLPAPKGVKSADWEGLKAELARSIRHRLAGGPGRQTLAAPVTDSATARLLFDLDTSTFEWRYQNPGDYNQDGEVNISDLTPLAVHLGSAVPTTPGGENSIQAVVDGDGNGQVTIADITPLGAALGRRITEFRLYFGSSPAAYPVHNDDPPAIPHFASVAVADFQGSRSTERVYFTYPFVPLTDGLYWTRPADGSDDSVGTPSKPLQTDFLADVTAALSATPYIGTAPLTVTLDASATVGPGVTFQWDLEGDGTFVDTGFNDTLIHIYTVPAAYTAAVKVISPSGFFRTASVGINAGDAAAWYQYPLPELRPEEVPLAISINEYAGQPLALVSYQTVDPGLFGLDYYLAATPNGSSWGGREVIYDTAAEPINRLTTFMTLGDPAFSAATPSTLLFGRAEALPGSWTLAPASLVNEAQWFSMKEINGLVSLSYYDPFHTGLRFAREGSPTQTPVAGTQLGECASLAAINGSPAIAYLDSNGVGTLRYVDSVPGSSPLDWNFPSTMIAEADGSRFFDSLLELADGSPGLFYFAPSVSDVRFRRAITAAGDSWTVAAVAPVTSGPELIPRAVMVGDIPHGFWYDPGAGALLHSYALDSGALDWADAEVVTTDIESMILPAPAAVDGYPAVGYISSSGELRFALRY
jgi:hypothetical protein